MTLRVGLTFDLRREHALAPGMPADRFAELDDERTIDALDDALTSLGHRVVRIGGLPEVARLVATGAGVDVVFNVAEGVRGRGREAQVPVLLEALGMAYTGSDPVALAATLDKALTKRLWAAAGLPTPVFHVVADGDDLDALTVAYPRFVKPVAEGSSMGVDAGAIVHDAGALRERVAWVWRRYRQPALVEAYLPGREFTVAIVDRHGRGSVLGAVETAPAGGLRGYEEKRAMAAGDGSFGDVGDTGLERELGSLALRAYRAVAARDLGRVDLRCDASGAPQLLEINALPGLTPDRSAMAQIARRAGVSFRSLIALVLDGALRRRDAALAAKEA